MGGRGDPLTSASLHPAASGRLSDTARRRRMHRQSMSVPRGPKLIQSRAPTEELNGVRLTDSGANQM